MKITTVVINHSRIREELSLAMVLAANSFSMERGKRYTVYHVFSIFFNLMKVLVLVLHYLFELSH